MITAGMDIGTGSTKGVIMEDGEKILHARIDESRGIPAVRATKVLDDLLQEAKLELNDLEYIASTGYGRYQMEQRDIQISDLTTTGRGANHIYDEPRLVLDIGTQSTRALRINEKGKIIQFKMNERCAAGSGRFIERCSKYLVVPMQDVSELALKSEKPQQISSVCAVLSETEIINHVALGVPVEDIFMGVFQSIADRAGTLLKRLKMDSEVFMTGGLVHMAAMQQALKNVLDFEVHLNPQAHYAAAIGAARLGHQRALKRASVN
ncbi:MAG: acyl-CoA dehydratase activase [Candidatus Kariarchaeaceae archaeon]|jgi:predicted CoA-substrate-specific enzyme activase